MKISKIMLIALILGGFAVALVGCAKSTAGTQNQTATVKRGNITVDVTATGNLAYSHKEDLAFKTSGTVEQILVQAGDSVKTGQVLAQLDTTSLEQAVTAAERAVKTAEVNLEQATNDYYKLILPNVYQTYQFILPDAVNRVGDAQQQIKEAIAENQKGLTSQQYSMGDIDRLLKETRDILSEVKTKLGWFLIPSTSLDYWTLRAAQIKIDTAQSALDSQNDALNEAKDNLAKAAVVAPFDGFVTLVNVTGGEAVGTGTVAVEIADPTKFEVDVMVSEMDIFQVKSGGDASVQIDATQISLPAKVTNIAPTATIQQGVVNYKVTVEVQSLQPIQPSTSGGTQTPQSTEDGQASSPNAPQATLVKEGLSVTITIPVQQKNNVLLVPNRAISRQGKNTVVQVLNNGVTESRTIKTGISDFQNTEVTDGLGEGEEVIIPQATTTTSTPSPGQGIFGIGR